MALVSLITKSKRKRNVEESKPSCEQTPSTKAVLKARLRKRRKLGHPSAKSSRKVSLNSAKASESGWQEESLDTLPWKRISSRHFPGPAIGDAEGGLLEIDEISDVEVVYDETDGGRIAKFRLLGNKSKPSKAAANGTDDRGEGSSLSSSESDDDESEEETEFDTSLLPEWTSFALKPSILSSLHSQSFMKPTPIQERALPLALKGKDVIGIAETGSGKTLAYGLPILQDLYSRKLPKGRRPIRALVLTPTRELALQVAAHLSACVQISPTEVNGDKKKKAPHVSIAAVVGGMSAQKQKRVLERGADILVATPGRLWDLIEESDELANDMANLRFLVLDEADRMVEAGHFEEVESILRMTARKSERGADEIDGIDFEDEESGAPAEGRTTDEGASAEAGPQTFVFSATMSRDLQQNLKKRKRIASKKGENSKPKSTLDELLFRLDFRDPEPEIIDLSPQGGMVSSLKESLIECLTSDKDLYLYYFLLRYPGRSLVFLSSVDGIRRLLPISALLNLDAHPLHSHLQQRQRLKNLDRFRANPNGILLATDVAARGLDIPEIDHVIHYQVPRSADVYIHRNGRTARALRDGFSLLMCAPDERKLLRALMMSLDRAGQSEIPQMPIELDLVDKLKARVELARKIDSAAHRSRKEKHEKNWLKEAAEAMEIELDSDLEEGGSDEDARPMKRKEQKTQALKAELMHLLAQPLVAQGVMRKYITSGARGIAAELLKSNGDEMLGFRRGKAKADLESMHHKHATRKTGKAKKGKPVTTEK